MALLKDVGAWEYGAAVSESVPDGGKIPLSD